jgi:ubiquinol-cytochrome c reductase cytochrome c1 subunit
MNKLASLLFAALCAFAGTALAAGGPAPRFEPAPTDGHDVESLQRGARLFVNYCLNCHSAKYMRYNRLVEIGLTPEQIGDNLVLTGRFEPAPGGGAVFAPVKIGDTMQIAMRPADAKAWFGAPPPDLTVIARARSSEFGSGADWLYTYLRGFYRDESRPTGWNNVVFANVGMPHVLWELQGEQVMGADHKLTLAKPGKMKAAQYDETVADLVAYLQWMGEPMAGLRKKLGAVVLLALAVLFVFAYALKREYWKDIH